MWINPEPVDEELWQRSMALYFLDASNGCGGVIAVGLWPRRAEGTARVALTDGTTSRSGTALDRPDAGVAVDGIGVGDVIARCTSPGTVTVTASMEGARCELTCTDLYPPTPWDLGADGKAALADKATGHVESAVQVTGTVTIDGSTTEVDGLGQRDQSWGARSHEGVRSYRWSVGTTGPDLSWSALVLQVHDLPLFTTGYLVLDGTVEPLTSVDTLVTVGHDSITPHAWTSRLAAADRQVEIVSERVFDRFCDVRPPMVASDALASVRVDGRPGFGALNMIVNPQLGTALPTTFDGHPW